MKQLHVTAPEDVFSLATIRLILKTFPSLKEMVVDLPGSLGAWEPGILGAWEPAWELGNCFFSTNTTGHPLTKWPFSVLSLQLLYKLC